MSRVVRAVRASRLTQQLALAGAAVVSMAAAVSTVRPVYAGREPVLHDLLTANVSWRDSVAARAPWAASPDSDAALRSPRFEADRLAFVQDLVGTGRLDPDRAEAIGAVAVREAYKRRLPPALVFGVLLTENGDFRSGARSRKGAVGLMQIAPKVWIPTLARYFGRNLTRDETNLQYGIHILSYYLYRSADQFATADSAVTDGLLRYNGCVRGRRAVPCQHYPDKVRAMVEQYAVAQCGSAGFDGCVAQPLRLSFAGGKLPDVTLPTLDSAEIVAAR